MLFPLLDACHRNSTPYPEPGIYAEEITQWRNDRLARLKSRTGWLNLAGLYWLQEGQNTFGSDSSNNIVFPSSAPAFIGMIERRGDSIYLRSASAPVKINDIIAGNLKLRDDATGKPDIMTVDSFAWHIIKRGTQYGIRLRDYNSALANELDSVPCFNPNLKWMVTAEYKPFAKPEIQKVQTVIGVEAEIRIPGELIFRINGKKMRLLPVETEDGLSVIFGDLTNGYETYPAGRYLDTSKPDSSNHVVIDFNKAYNPPCAYTPYATCQLPHRDNILPVKIESGEKAVHFGSHI